MKTETMTHEQMVAKMLKDPAVRAEHDRLNREEFAMLDSIAERIAEDRAKNRLPSLSNARKVKLDDL